MSDPQNEDFNPYQSPEAPSRRPEAETLFDLHGIKSIRVAGSLSLEDAGKVSKVPPMHPVVFRVASVFLVGVVALMGLLCVYFYYIALRDDEYKFGGYMFGIVSSCFVGFVALCGFVALLLEARAVKRMWRQQRGIFAHGEITILPHGTERKVGDTTLSTPWSDYESYRIAKDLIVLRVRGRALKRRCSQDPPHLFTPVERTLGLDWADLFARRNFPGDAEWEFFLLLLKRTLRRA